MKVPFRLFANQLKTGNQPDFKSGLLNVDGAFYTLACWKQLNPDGTTYLSCSLETAMPSQVEKDREEKLAIVRQIQKRLNESTTPPPPALDADGQELPF